MKVYYPIISYFTCCNIPTCCHINAFIIFNDINTLIKRNIGFQKFGEFRALRVICYKYLIYTCAITCNSRL